MVIDVVLRRTALCVMLCALLIWGAPARASEGGTISGTVHDGSGAVVPDCVVTVRNSETGVQQSTRTNMEGYFVLSAVPVGNYEIEIHHPGFKTYKRTGLAVSVNTQLAADAQLQMGEEFQQVTVSGSAVHIDTEETQMGQVMQDAKIAALPMNGRSFTDLTALQPGIVPASSQPPNSIVMAGVATSPPSGDQNPGNLSINGQQEITNGFIVNGADVEEDLNMGTAILPNLDSISEFRVLTSNFDAEYGNYSGGQIIVETKAGGNGFHGDAFEFVRNTAFDAKSFFSPQRAEFDRHQFGGTFGGPIKRRKVFFFTDYQGTRTTEGIESGIISVPSLTDRSGNLADGNAGALSGSVSSAYIANLLTQRLGYTVTQGEAYSDVFPGSVIPKKAWSAPALNLLQFIPTPNLAANNFYTAAEEQTVHDDKGAARIDAATQWGTISTYYFVDHYDLNNPYPTGQGGANVPGFNAISRGQAQLLSLGLVTSIGANTVNEFHFSFMRDSNNIGEPRGGVGPSLASQGFLTGPETPGIVPLAPEIEGIENVALNTLGVTFGVDITGLVQRNNTFQWRDNYSTVIATHTVKFGGEYHSDQLNNTPNATFNGTFAFNGTETGSDYADFLLGIATQYIQAQQGSFYPRNQYAGLFAQDSWKVKPNITLNYGVRWELIPPWHEKYNQIETLVPGRQSVVFPGAPEGFLFPSDPGVPKALSPTRWSNFSPRIGIAYSPRFDEPLLKKVFGGPGTTSIRAGYGMFYTAFQGLSVGIMYSIPPYGFNYVNSQQPLFEAPFVSAQTGTDISGDCPTPWMPGDAFACQLFPASFPGFGASAKHPDTTVNWSKLKPISGDPAFSNHNVVPYGEHYNLSFERQFRNSVLFTLGYAGSEAHHLLVLEESNPGNPALCPQPLSTTCNVDATRPLWPAFGGNTLQRTMGNSNYNALEASIHYRKGASDISAGYTYAKSIDQSSNLGEAVNPFDPRYTRAISAFDLKHNFVATYKYELPWTRAFGRNRWTEGWFISGTTRFSTGLPVTLYNDHDDSLLGTNPNGVNNHYLDEPQFTAGPLEVNTNPRNGRPAFNTSLFTRPALGTLGNARRRFFYGPGINNWDIALLKTVRITEPMTLELRLEAFNVFNHGQFFGPVAENGYLDSPNFGQIVTAAGPRIVQLGAKFYF